VSLFIVVGGLVAQTGTKWADFQFIILLFFGNYLLQDAIMEPEASSNASQIVGSNTDNLYGVIDKDK
jgi:hypothetical protein